MKLFFIIFAILPVLTLANSANISWKVLGPYHYYGNETVEERVFTDPKTFSEYFSKKAPKASATVNVVPKIDFSKEVVVVILDGGKASTGYDVVIDSITEDASARKIKFHIEVPICNRAYGDAYTYPSKTFTMHKTTKKIVFEKAPSPARGCQETAD